jgi:TonB family protein
MIMLDVLTLAAAAVVATAPAAPAQGAQGAPKLLTEVFFQVGQPAADAPAPPAELVPPGVVLLVESRGGSVTERYAKIRQELREAYRLGEMAKGTKTMVELAAGAAGSVSSPVPGMQAWLKPLSFDDVKATYEVRLEEPGREPAVTRVAVKRGDFAIVGGRDGAAAPYFFMLIRPLTRSEEEDEAKWEGKTRPKLVQKVQPTYPEALRQARVMDVIVLELSIDAAGAVTDATLVAGKVPELIEAARQAVLQWRFEPARDAAGKAFAAKYTITTAFKLE